MKVFIRSVLGAALLIGAAVLYAQEGPDENRPVSLAVDSSSSGNVSFDFKEADLRNVLRIFATKADVNIIAGPEVKGSVTMRLHDIPWEKALQLILEVNDYSYQRDGNVIKVLSRAAMAKQPTQTQVFFLNYADAKKLEKSVSQLLSKDGSIKTDERSNSLIVTDQPNNLAKVAPVVARLDQQTPQVLVQSMIVETNAIASEDIGVNWAFLGGDGLKLGIDSIANTYTHTHSTSRSFTTTKLTTASSTLLTTNFSSQSATQINAAFVFSTSTSTVSNLLGNTFQQLSSNNIFSRFPQTANVQTATLTAGNLDIFLSFLESTTDTKVLSAPEVLTTNNTTASVMVGEQYPLANYVFNQTTGTLEVQGFNYIDIGIKLHVTPKISPDGYVTLIVKPEIKEQGDPVAFGGSVGTFVPIIKTQEAEVNAVVKDRETLVIGGLIKDDASNVIHKLPLLGDLPIIGPRLFSDSSVTKTRRNIFIFVTPTIVTSKNAAAIVEKRRRVVDTHVDFPKKEKSFWSKWDEKGHRRDVDFDINDVYANQKPAKEKENYP